MDARTPTKSLRKPVGLKRFHVFAAPYASAKKLYVASFHSGEEAIRAAKAGKTHAAMRWQVLDSFTSDVIAEDPGR